MMNNTDRQKKIAKAVKNANKRFYGHMNPRRLQLNIQTQNRLNYYQHCTDFGVNLYNQQYPHFRITDNILNVALTEHVKALKKWGEKYKDPINEVQRRANNYSDQTYEISGNFFAKCFEIIHNYVRNELFDYINHDVKSIKISICNVILYDIILKIFQSHYDSQSTRTNGKDTIKFKTMESSANLRKILKKISAPLAIDEFMKICQIKMKLQNESKRARVNWKPFKKNFMTYLQSLYLKQKQITIHAVRFGDGGLSKLNYKLLIPQYFKLETSSQLNDDMEIHKNYSTQPCLVGECEIPKICTNNQLPKAHHGIIWASAMEQKREYELKKENDSLKRMIRNIKQCIGLMNQMEIYQQNQLNIDVQDQDEPIHDPLTLFPEDLHDDEQFDDILDIDDNISTGLHIRSPSGSPIWPSWRDKTPDII